MDVTLIVAGVLLVALVAGGLVWQRTRVNARGNVAVDDELRDVFLTEARSEVASLARSLPAWRQVPTDLERVAPLRRTFHTLKGSGLMVGADKLAELGAVIERILVRVIERELAPRADVIEVVARAVAAVPGLVDAFAAGRRPGGEVSAIVAAAERLLRQPAAGPRKVAVAQSEK